MPNFKYKAYDRKGHVVESEIEGDSASAVSRALTEQNYIPVSISEVKNSYRSSKRLHPWVAVERGKGESESDFSRILRFSSNSGIEPILGSSPNPV